MMPKLLDEVMVTIQGTVTHITSSTRLGQGIAVLTEQGIIHTFWPEQEEDLIQINIVKKASSK